MNRILITGALGQLGSELVKRLSNQDNTFVLATDIRFPQSLTYPCSFEQLDVLNHLKLSRLIKDYNINCIYHLVAMLSAKGEQQPFMTWNLNVTSFQHIIQLALKNNIQRIFWPSSIAVYGEDRNEFLAPQECQMNPTTMYGVSKLAGEKLINYYRKIHNLDIRSLRLPGIVATDTLPGGGTTDFMIEMLHHAKQNKTYQCFLSANTRLPMIYLEDALNAILTLMSKPHHMIRSIAYNVMGFNITPKEWVEALTQAGLSLKVTYRPDFRQKIAQSWPKSLDDSLSLLEWGWKPLFDAKATAKAVS